MCLMIGVGLFGVKTVKETDYWTHYQSPITELIKEKMCVFVTKKKCVYGERGERERALLFVKKKKKERERFSMI